MVFSSSVPVYLDPPNWQQQQHHQQQQQQQQNNHDHHHHHHQNPHLPAQPPPPPPLGGPGPAKPGSMAERARLAKIPQPEAALKCPRCESTNTKFCYFNNYSLTQPRHFCKTCRRYWTRGGSLRSVPVGGGCGRNKRSSTKPSSSKSKPTAAGDNGPRVNLAPPAHLPFLPPIDHYMAEAGGLGFPAAEIFPAEPWRHFPFPGPTTGNAVLYPNNNNGQAAVKVLEGVSSTVNGIMINGNAEYLGLNNNLSRNFLGVLGNINHDHDHHHDHYGTTTTFGGSNAWTDQLSSFTTSSSTNHNLM